ncbi:MAG: hypothetical protein V7K25_27040 [Nostoc sp.]|uniref:hypothetical protein n=1 Tax=Nostoc sp. TaxID=1180 RepID=UPI002FF6C0AE
MESTLFTTLTVTEEASLSGGHWKKPKPPVTPPVKPPTTPAPTTTNNTTTTTGIVSIITQITGPAIAIAPWGVAAAQSGSNYNSSPITVGK